jgi:hypothetical protein
LDRCSRAGKEYAGVIESSIAKLTAELAKITKSDVKPLTAPKTIVPRHVVVLPKSTTCATNTDISGPEQRILDAIAWMESIGIAEPEQTAVAFLADYTYGGGGFNNPKGSLRSKGLVEYRSDRIAFTEGGRELANVPEQALTSDELQRKVLERLHGPERKLLTVLLQRYPEEISNEELAEQSGYTFGAGGFNNPRGRLRSLGLIEYLPGGKVKARSLLFPV